VTERLASFLNFRRGELPLAALSVLFHFCVLCGYYFLRPVRDAMGMSSGMDQLRWLFLVTSFVSLGIVLAFGGVVARTNRRRFIPIAYLFVIVCLFGFSGLLIMDARAGGGLIGTDAETALAQGVGYTFYVWLSGINLFVTSVFWAFMVDLFDTEQGKRIFGFIAIGGTLGASIGGWTTSTISGMTESVYLPAILMLIGSALFAAAIAVMLTLDRLALKSEHSRHSVDQPVSSDQDLEPGERIGGTFWDGAAQVVKSPYMLGIGLWVVLMAVANTMIYFTQANIITGTADTFSQAVAGFAQFDMWANIATGLTQLFVTTRVIKKLGVGWTLALLPIVTMAGFAVLAIWPIFGVMVVFQAIHRATRYAMSRPARETLWSAVTPAEKYKGKPVVDVFLYRGGDVAGVGVDSLFAALGLTLGWVAAATVPLAGGWVVLSKALGRAQQDRADETMEAPEAEPEPAAV
jgi:AAA family ATP:ADP antiporter